MSVPSWSWSKLRQIYAMDGADAPHIATVHHIDEAETLLMKQMPQFEQESISCEVVEPVDGLQVVAGTIFGPAAPVAQRLLGQGVQLIAEILGEEADYSLISRGRVVLLHDFQHHHARPPVVRVVALQSRFARIVLGGAEEAVFALALQGPFYPGLHFSFQSFIVQYVGKGQQSVNPVRAALPLVAVAAQPAVAFAHHQGVEYIHLPAGTVLLAHEHLLQPALRTDAAQRKLHQGFAEEGIAVVGIVIRHLRRSVCSGRRKAEQCACQEAENCFLSHIRLFLDIIFCNCSPVSVGRRGIRTVPESYPNRT